MSRFYPEIKFVKTHPDAQLPKANNVTPATGDTGSDIFCVEDTLVPAHSSKVVPTGITVAYIEPGYWFDLASRSGLAFKHNITVYNGTIDNLYRGDLGLKIFNFSDKDYQFKKGDKVAQLRVYPLVQPEISWSEEIDQTSRGANGFGSTGR